jgi:hypothetical protein
MEYHGEFEFKPLFIETLNLKTTKKNYEFDKRFPACTQNDVDDATTQIDSTTAKPFDGNTISRLCMAVSIS